MSIKDFEILKRSLKAGQTANLIRLKKFSRVDGAYLRRDFIHPREVKIEGNTVSFLVENWVTFKDCLVSIDYTDIAYFEITKKPRT